MAYIVRLRGALIEKTPAVVTIECAGVGYALAVPLSTFDRLPALGEEATLFVHHVVREDDELLFGFHTDRERHFFRTLLTISGIGPKLALSQLHQRIALFSPCLPMYARVLGSISFFMASLS